MAYRCPVCAVLQPDGEHLANHLAITAMLDRPDHAEWLEEHAPDYGSMGPAALAERIDPAVEQVALEDGETAVESPPEGPSETSEAAQPPFEHALERQTGHGRTAPGGDGASLDAETRAVMAEARRLTVGEDPDRERDGPTEQEAEPDSEGSA